MTNPNLDDVKALAERLLERMKSKTGQQIDGRYAPSFYMEWDAILDRKAADLLSRLASQREDVIEEWRGPIAKAIFENLIAGTDANGKPIISGFNAATSAVLSAIRSLPSREAIIEEWRPIETAPKDGKPILAKVKDWYSREVRYFILSFSINAYWESAYTGDQTFEPSDIVGWKPLEARSLAAQPPTEPVAWRIPDYDDNDGFVTTDFVTACMAEKNGKKVIPLYATPTPEPR